MYHPVNSLRVGIYVLTYLLINSHEVLTLRWVFLSAWHVKLFPLQLAQKQAAVVQERQMAERDGDGRISRITFDVFEWVFQCDLAEPKDAYIYK